ncbi:hypothetical protein H1R20_g7017, partial [Candolleomyces eurysporus]
MAQLLNVRLNDWGTSWLAVILLLMVMILSRRLYSYWFQNKSARRRVRSPGDTTTVQTHTSRIRFRDFTPTLSETNLSLLKHRDSDSLEGADPAAHDMRYHPRWPKKKKVSVPDVVEPPKRVEQPVDMFLVLDIEGTCNKGTDFNFPNEIIEFPVCLLRWKDKTEDDTASELEVVDEFRTFVRPTWRPILSDFCRELTGITQEQVDSAPVFSEVLDQFKDFMIKHGMINEHEERLVRFSWCSDGPFDVRDFVVKQCHISKVRMPSWLQGDVLDIRTTVVNWATLQLDHHAKPIARRSANIAAQLKVLGLPDFQGREHSGIDVSTVDFKNLPNS